MSFTIYWPVIGDEINEVLISTNLTNKEKENKAQYWVLGYHLHNCICITHFSTDSYTETLKAIKLLPFYSLKSVFPNDLDTRLSRSKLRLLGKLGFRRQREPSTKLIDFSINDSGEIYIKNTDSIDTLQGKELKWIYFRMPTKHKLSYYYLSSFVYGEIGNLKNMEIAYPYNESKSEISETSLKEIFYVINKCAELNNYKENEQQDQGSLVSTSFNKLCLKANDLVEKIVLKFNLEKHKPTVMQSLFINQVLLRYKNIAYLVKNSSKIKRHYYSSDTAKRKEIMEYMNLKYMVVNDWILGILLCIILSSGFIEKAVPVVKKIAQYYLLDSIKVWIDWLQGYPAGLKINSELSLFLCELFLWLVSLWEITIADLFYYMPTSFSLLGFTAAVLGVSSSIALFNDWVTILSLHIGGLYLVSAKLYRWQVILIRSLFNLFRGKKYNQIKNRIESAEYRPDQLVIGTILFTFLIFLFPTITVFYFTFAMFKLCLVYFHALVEIALNLLNNFPLFTIISKCANPESIPSGIYFELKNDCNDNSDRDIRLLLKSWPLSLGEVFEVYSGFFKHLKSNYLSINMAISLLTGKTLSPEPQFYINNLT